MPDHPYRLDLTITAATPEAAAWAVARAALVLLDAAEHDTADAMAWDHADPDGTAHLVATTVTPCPPCQGSGVVPEHHGQGMTEWLGCPDCQGTGTDHGPHLDRLAAPR